MSRKLGLIAAACFACALCFALVGCGGVNKAAYTGEWALESGSDESLDAESIALMKSLGLEVTLTMKEDGTGTLNLFGEAIDLTWEAKSNTEGTVTFNGSTAALKLVDGKLTIEDNTGSSMTFVKSDGTASASASASSASASAGSESAANSEAAASSEASAASEEAASSSAASSAAASDEAASAEASSSSAAAA